MDQKVLRGKLVKLEMLGIWVQMVKKVLLDLLEILDHLVPLEHREHLEIMVLLVLQEKGGIGEIRDL